MTRHYRSAVRHEQASRTRAALLDACEALLLEGTAEAVTLPAVARRAGVTKPTAYSYFPDNDALLAGFIDHVRGRISMDLGTLTRIPPARLPAAARKNFRLFDKHARLLQRMMDSPGYERVRLARKVDRAGMALPVWQEIAAGSVLRQRLGPIYLLVSPASWRWLRETWGLSGAEAAGAAAWAIEALTSALGAAPTNKRKSATRQDRASRRKDERLRMQARQGAAGN